MPAEYKLLSCDVMRDEAEYILRELGTAERFDIDWFEMGLHEQPEKLNAELRRRIALCEGAGYQAILILFGLCSRATAGLEPPADSRLVIPRVHDCVSLYLGSANTYLAEHAAEAGTFWFSRGFLHRPDGQGVEFSGLGSMGDFVVGPDGERRAPAEIRQRFVEEYGEDNAEYLMETLIESWKKNYRRAVYLDWDKNPGAETDRAFVENYAAENNWRFETRPVNLRLVRMLLGGPWPEEEFVVVEPGKTIVATNGDDAMKAGEATIHN